MNKLIHLLLLLLCSSLLHAGSLLSPTQQAFYLQAQDLLAGRANLSQLEQQLQHYRSQQLRSPEGDWMLDAFYQGFTQAMQAAPDQFEAVLQQWQKTHPGALGPKLLYARLLLLRDQQRPWYKQSVRRDWSVFYSEVAQARSYLQQLNASYDPYWHQLMLMVARQQWWEPAEFEVLLQQAWQRFPSYYPIYLEAQSYYATVHSPSLFLGIKLWPQRDNAITRLRELALQNTRQQEGHTLYARLYWHAREHDYFANPSDWQMNWPLVSQGIQDLLQRYPSQWNIQNFAVMACERQDKTQMQRLRGSIKPPLLLPAETMAACPNQSKVISSNTSPDSPMLYISAALDTHKPAPGQTENLRMAFDKMRPHDKPDILLGWAKFNLINGDAASAITALDTLIKMHPTSADAYAWRAYTRLPNAQQALADTQRAAELKSKHAMLSYVRGELLRQQRQWTQAEHFYHEALEQGEDSHFVETLAFNQLEQRYLQTDTQSNRTALKSLYASWSRRHYLDAAFALKYSRFMLCEQQDSYAARSLVEMLFSTDTPVSAELRQQLNLYRAASLYLQWKEHASELKKADSLWQEANQYAHINDVLKLQNQCPILRQLSVGMAQQAQRATEPMSPGTPFKPGRTFRDCPECPNMVIAPAGWFTMGYNVVGTNTYPSHAVTFKQPFAIGQQNVSHEEWYSIMGSYHSQYETDCKKYRNRRCPIFRATWEEAQQFVQKLSASSGKRYRLPSEAEWEYSCLSGNVMSPCYQEDYFGRYAPDGKEQSNSLGIHRMGGNYELVEDIYHDDFNGAPEDGSAWVSGGDASRRVVRDSSKHRESIGLRSRMTGIKFRVARDLL